mmetsp:Transcript_5027/g.16193  ORF Transcript_5027/g.16193 Transcript_5027/m.16193 type:complete len:207 (-) Transcript_5027:110-730(-)
MRKLGPCATSSPRTGGEGAGLDCTQPYSAVLAVLSDARNGTVLARPTLVSPWRRCATQLCPLRRGHRRAAPPPHPPLAARDGPHKPQARRGAWRGGGGAHVSRPLRRQWRRHRRLGGGRGCGCRQSDVRRGEWRRAGAGPRTMARHRRASAALAREGGVRGGVVRAARFVAPRAARGQAAWRAGARIPAGGAHVGLTREGRRLGVR